MLTVLERTELLQKAQIFRAVRTESLAAVAAIAEEVSFDASHVLYAENDAADTMFMLLEGEVAVLRDRREVRRIGADQVVGVLALLAGDSHNESAVATRPIRALRIDQQEFYDVMSEDFHIALGILRAVVSLAPEGA